MDKNFNTFIFSLKTNIYDKGFEKDLIELAEMSVDFRNDIIDFCQKNKIKPLTEYSSQKAVEIFQLLSRYCCERSIHYGLSESGDDEIYTY